MKILLVFLVLVCVGIISTIPEGYAENETPFDFTYYYKETWTKLGDKLWPSSLRNIAIDSKENLYLIDLSKLHKLTVNNELVWSVNLNFTGVNEVYVNQNDEIIVPIAQGDMLQIIKFSESGKILKTWGNAMADDVFIETSPDAILSTFVDDNDTIFILEQFVIGSKTPYSGTLKKYNSDGDLLKTYNDMGKLRYIDDEGNLYVAELGTLVKYNPNGEKITQFGNYEHRGPVGTFGENGALAVTISSDGIIYATGGDYGPINLIQQSGEFSSIGSYGICEKCYGSPRGIALDSEYTAYVTDYSRDKILVFERNPKPIPAPVSELLSLSDLNESPIWVRNIFIWYGQNQISENELINAMQFLINEEIIKIKS